MTQSGGAGPALPSDADARLSWGSVTLGDVLDRRVWGLALMLAWQFITFFSPAIHYSTRNDVSHFNSVVGYSSLGLVAVLLVAAGQAGVFSRAMGRPVLRWATPVALVLSTIVLAIVDVSEVFRQPWCSIAAAISGVGLGVLYLAWGDVLRRLNIVEVTVKTASAFLLAAVLFALTVMLPKLAAVVITSALPIGVGAILFQGLGVWRTTEEVGKPALHQGAFSVRAVFSLGVLSLAGSFARSFFLAGTPIVSDGSYPWLFLMATIGAIVIVCGPLLSATSPDFAAAYKTSVFALGFVMLLLPLLEPGSFAADAAGVVTYCVVMLLMWVVLARLTGLYGLSPLFAFGIGWASCMAGLLAGTFGGALVLSTVAVTPRLLSLVTLLCVCLLFFAYLFLFTESTMARLLGGGRFGRRPFRERCHQLRVDFNLTEREEEVLVLVAKGRSTPRIREELGLTAGTVNAHLSHLYRKLDVHDRQELIDLVESER